MAAYFDGKHHPQQALLPRTGYVAVSGADIVGYIAGHRTTRHGCEGEVQYLFVAPASRRQGIGTALFRLLGKWFREAGVRKVCVGVADDSPPEARPFVERLGATPLRKHWYAWDDVGFGIEMKSPANRLMRFPSSVKRDPAIHAWMREHSGALGTIAKRWFEVMRGCGDDVRELLHDGHPTACVGDAAFAYVNAFTAHVNVGFFRGAEIADPKGLLEGTGKFMRHVKLRPERDVDATALMKLIETAYTDMKGRR
jgi:hypothetical protein